MSDQPEKLVTVTDHQQEALLKSRPYALLRPGKHLPRYSPDNFPPYPSKNLLDSIRQSKIVAVDLETRGADYSKYPEDHIVGIGLAWNEDNCYFQWADLYPHTRRALLLALYTHRGLLAHNVYFDGGFLYQEAMALGMDVSGPPVFLACTYALYCHLANEGYIGQKHSLKHAQTDLLGWEETNEIELDTWLRGAGYVNKSGGVLKQEMWRAPLEILGKYCSLDAESTYLLYTQVLEPGVDLYPAMREYTEDFLHMVNILIVQKIVGILVDVERLSNYRDKLQNKIVETQNSFLSHPSILQYVEELESTRLQEFVVTEPTKYKKSTLGTEPQKYKKDGTTISRSWEHWYAKSQKPPEVTKTWLNWDNKLREISAGKNPKYRFNINSGPDIRWLLFDKLGLVSVDQTESGLPAIGAKSLQAMGEVGGLLTEYRGYEKELSYVEDYLERARSTPDIPGHGTIHPSYKTPGTSTGRLSGKDPNIQQMPKTIDTMSCFTARPGHVWVDLDFSALEPVVTTELSGDKNMYKIYGPGVPANDIYLFIGAHIPGLRDPIMRSGYDPNRPTPESITRAKKLCKHERNICKTVHLACAYGAGPKKIHKTLQLGGIDLSEDEVYSIWKMYWELFSGVRNYSLDLQETCVEQNRILVNGLGRPVCVDADYMKDCMNRVVQSTGHDILVKYIRLFTTELDKASIPWTPIIIDWHDASTIEVPEHYAETVVRIMDRAVDELNKIVGTKVPLRGEAEIGLNLADVKKPEA